MIIYSISSLLNKSIKTNEIKNSFPFLESFFGSYVKSVNEDRKTPLFSKTTKYNNFPVRCHWKGITEKNNKYIKPSEIQKKPIILNVDMKNNNEDLENSKLKMIPTKINKDSGIKGVAIKILNKITDDNFEAQSSELLKMLCENKEKTSVLIIANLILEKIWYDKAYYKLYINLCKKIWDTDDWVTESYQVFCIEKGDIKKIKEYFYILNFELKKEFILKAPILKGPFKSHEIAESCAKKMVNFKSIFFGLCRDNFYKREFFINEMIKIQDSNQKYKLKRQFFGTVEILGHLYNMGHMDENIIHYILLSLLHTDSQYSNGAIYEEEIEAFKLLWDIVHYKIGSEKMSEYNNLLKVEEKKKWSSRIKFMLDDMLKYFNNISNEGILNKYNINDELKKNEKEIVCDSDEESKPIEKEIVCVSDEESKPIEKEIVCDSDEESKHIEKEIINLSRNFNNENKNDIFTLLKNISKLSSFSMSLVANIIKDSTEYGEYADNHSSTILSFLENYDISKLSFENLSKAISTAGEDIGDIKIDVPKAPKNMSFIIGKILKGTKTGKIEININKTTVFADNDMEMDNSKKEWDNIFKLTENFIDKDTLINRFEILKYNNQ